MQQVWPRLRGGSGSLDSRDVFFAHLGFEQDSQVHGVDLCPLLDEICMDLDGSSGNHWQAVGKCWRAPQAEGCHESQVFQGVGPFQHRCPNTLPFAQTQRESQDPRSSGPFSTGEPSFFSPSIFPSFIPYPSIEDGKPFGKLKPIFLCSVLGGDSKVGTDAGARLLWTKLCISVLHL